MSGESGDSPWELCGKTEVTPDPVTGLPNRALFIDRLGQVLHRAERRPDTQCAVLMLDVDRFKVISESLGPTAGDRMLVKIARRLEELLRPGDDNLLAVRVQKHSADGSVNRAMAEEIILRIGFEQLPVVIGSLLLAAGAAIVISTGKVSSRGVSYQPPTP